MSLNLEQACRHALRQNLALTRGERVLIITDAGLRPIGEVLQTAATALTHSVMFVEIPIPEIDGTEPPTDVAEAMQAVDVVLMPTSKSLSWTEARRAATASGARIASMPRITEETILRTFPMDYQPIRRRVNRMCDRLDAARGVRLTTTLGTDLTFSVEGRKAHGRKGGIYTRPGFWGNLPCGEAFIAPVEGTAEGVYVVDASQAGVGPVETPIRVRVEAGRAVEITGGVEATGLNHLLESVGSHKAYNLAEFGIGANHGARICGLTLEDEKVLGTCHIALGKNSLFDGTVDVPVHVDGVLKAPTIYLDGEKVIEAGRWLIESDD